MRFAKAIRRRVLFATVIASVLIPGAPLAQDDFLEDGGSIDAVPSIVFGREGDGEKGEFLDGGRSIEVTPDVVFSDGSQERQEFLEDGGSIRSVPRIFGRIDRGGYYLPASPRIVRKTRNSLVVISSDSGNGGGYYAGSVRQGYGLAGGPRTIDVQTERLDRRPIGPSGIEVSYTGGGAKVIRIAADYEHGSASAPSAKVSLRPGAGSLEPWKPAWLSFCTRTHPSFDPEFGTYTAADGRSRFCTAE